MNWLQQFLTGFLIGLANLIPGVSGGTFALILGVYERLISFLNTINSQHILSLVRLVTRWVTCGFNSTGRKNLGEFLVDHDYPFMTILAGGAITCIFSMSSLMKYLLLNHFIYTYAYFFGLIVISVIIPWRMIRRWNYLLLLPLVTGIFLTVFITASVNPYDKAFNKSKILETQYQNQSQQLANASAEKVTQADTFSFTGKYTTGEYLYIFLCGIVAISAMVLPGVSGSLVLILMNQYFAVISAIANIRHLLLDDLIFLSAMALGIVFGLITFARIIEFAFRKFHDPMVSFLVGLILGSLYSLWPFKQSEIIADYYVKEGSSIELIQNYTVHSNINILPSDLQSTLIASGVVIVGMLTMLIFLRQEKPQ